MVDLEEVDKDGSKEDGRVVANGDGKGVDDDSMTEDWAKFHQEELEKVREGVK